MPGFPVLHHLPEFAQTHIHWIGYAIQTISSSVNPFSSCLQSFSASGSFLLNQLFASGGQSIGASASVLPVNSHGWFPLGLTCLTSWLSRGLSRVFSSTMMNFDIFFYLWNFIMKKMNIFIAFSKVTHVSLKPLPTFILPLLRGQRTLIFSVSLEISLLFLEFYKNGIVYNFWLCRMTCGIWKHHFFGAQLSLWSNFHICTWLLEKL